MILLRKPEPYVIRRFLDGQLDAELNYAEVGTTRGVLPQGYATNETRRPIGHGAECFEVACQAFYTWQQLQLGWVYSWPQNAPLRIDTNIALLGRSFGLWWLSACRVVYVEEPSQPQRATQSRVFGYAVGTLHDHLLCGEERFVVEMKPDESVWVEIRAFSKPNQWLAKLGYPFVRQAQRRFGQQASQRVIDLVRTRVDRPRTPRESPSAAVSI